MIGSGNPIANGLAWASLLKGDSRVTVSSFGDGASNIGSFHEALNLASLWKLPVIFLCQNNRYAEHTAFSDGTAVATDEDAVFRLVWGALEVPLAEGENLARGRGDRMIGERLRLCADLPGRHADQNRRDDSAHQPFVYRQQRTADSATVDESRRGA